MAASRPRSCVVLVLYGVLLIVGTATAQNAKPISIRREESKNIGCAPPPGREMLVWTQTTPLAKGGLLACRRRGW